MMPSPACRCPAFRGARKWSTTAGEYSGSIARAHRRQRPQTRYFSRHRRDRAVDVVRGREATETEANRALRELIAAPERAQDIRGFVRSRCACRAGRHRQVAQREAQALTFDVVETNIE